MKPGAPWSVKGIDPKAREVAKSLAHARGQSLGEWMTQMILDAEGGAPEAGDAAAPGGAPQKALAPPAGPDRAAAERPGVPAAQPPGGPAAEPGGGAGGAQEARIVDALASLSRRLDQIEQRVTVGTQSLSRDVAVLREGLQNLGREFVATRRHTVAQQEAILKRTEQAIAAAGAANSGVTALQNRLQGLPGPSAAAGQPRPGQDGTLPGRQAQPSSAAGPTDQPSPIGEPAREMPHLPPQGSASPANPQGGPSGTLQAGPQVSSAASSAVSSQASSPQASPAAASRPAAAPAAAPPQQPPAQSTAPQSTAPQSTAPQPAAPQPAAPQPASPAPAQQQAGQKELPARKADAAPEQPPHAEPPAPPPRQTEGQEGAGPEGMRADGPQAADDDEDVEYEIVEYELQEGEDPADYAGSDEYEVVVEDAETQPAAPAAPAAPPPEQPSGGSLALRATGSAAAPRPPLRAVDLGPGGTPNGGQAGMRGQGGRRLRLPLGAQDMAAPEAGATDTDTDSGASARPGGLPRLSGGERPAITETKSSRGEAMDPLLAAVDRRVSGTRPPTEAGQRSGIFGMTWRKGLGQPPRPAAEAAAAAGNPEQPQADWENPAWGGAGETRGDPPGGPQPEAAATGSAAAAPAAEDAGASAPRDDTAAAGGPQSGPSAVVLPPPAAAAGEQAAATAAGAPQGPAAAADPTPSAGPAGQARPEADRPPPSGREAVAAKPGGAAGAAGAPGSREEPGSGPAAAAADGRLDGPEAGLRGASRRTRRERHGMPAGGAPPEEGWPDYAAAGIAPRRSRRRPLLLAAIGLLLVAGAAVVLALLGNSTAPDGIDYVALDQERRAQEGQPGGAPATSGETPAPATEGSAPAVLPAATGDAPRDTPRALADVPRADDGPRNGAEAAAAIAELRQASDAGSAQAAYELGLRLHDGIGVRRDPDAAAVQFQRAADLGYAPAQLALGVAYEQGQGVPRDLEQAAYWYAVAADQGNADAQFNFGTLYARGEGVDQDYYQAAKWYRRAADAGLADAQFNYANMLESGLGVQQDRQEAYRYYRMAAEAGDPVAAERERALAASLGADVVARLNAADAAARDGGDGAAEPAAEAMSAGDGALPAATAPAAAARSGPDDTAEPAPGAGQAGMTDMAAPATADRAQQMAPLSDRQEIAELQDLLNRLGFDAGPADGVIGSRTRTAIAAFQQAAGVTADGVPSRALLAELRQLAQTSR